MENLTLYSVIVIAFLGSFGHCIGMCGGIVLAYSSAKIDTTFSKQKLIIAHLLYSFGRTTTYMLLGALFGFLGSVVVFDRFATATLYLIAGIFMILASLSLLGKIQFLNSIEYNISKSSAFKRLFSAAISSKSLYTFYTLGVLNGLLPCGFVYFFAVAAAASANVFDGMLIMGLFGLATIPALFLVGFWTSFITKSKLRSVAIKVAALLVLGYGLYTLGAAYKFYVDPNASLTKCHSS